MQGNDLCLSLMEQVQSGNTVAFTELFRATSGLIRSRACSMVDDWSDAEDVVARVYEIAWMKRGTYDSTRGSVCSWLLTICRSHALDLLRARRARTRWFRELHHESDDLMSYPVEPDVDDSTFLDLHRRLSEIAPLKRRLITMAYFDEFTHAQIANALRMPLGTVKSHLRRGLQTLRETYEPLSDLLLE
jgi:RNA polymerase sigma factor (sigma-70 family)